MWTPRDPGTRTSEPSRHKLKLQILIFLQFAGLVKMTIFAVALQF